MAATAFPSLEPVEPTYDPEVTLWTALLSAGADDLSIDPLMDTTGKGRTWIYSRLRNYANTYPPSAADPR